MDKLIRSAPIVYAVFIVVGYFDLWTYYQLYHVNISAYLTITEVVTMTIPSILDYALGLYVALMVIAAWDGSGHAVFRREGSLPYKIYHPQKTLKKAGIEIRMGDWTRLSVSLVALCMSLCGALGCALIMLDVVWSPQWLFDHFAAGLVDYEVFMWFAIGFASGALNYVSGLREYVFAGYVLFVAWAVFSYGLYHNNQRVKDNANGTPCIKVNVTVEYGTTTVKTGETLKFVGEVQSAVFISNNRNGSTTVIPRAEIKRIVYVTPCCDCGNDGQKEGTTVQETS